jgi:LPXTG-site transpeptidase (sortase) family protein
MKRQLLGVIVFISIMVFTNTAVKAFVYDPSESEQSIYDPTFETNSDSLPKHIYIPAIGLSANVQHVGLGKSGNMAVPNGYQDVGWYRYGTLPGKRGSAVMDGHVDNGFGLAGVFKHLQELKVGDQIFYTAEDGTQLTFIVEEVQRYPINDVPLSKVFNRADEARLNLITCAGSWVESQLSYNERIVVYSRLLH